MLKSTERRLIKKAQSGDGAAVAALIEAHQASLYAFMLRLSGRPETAEDVVQEAFVRVIRNLDRFDDRFRFSTWLFTIAKRLYVNQRQKMQPRYDSDAIGDCRDRRSDDAPGAASDREESIRTIRSLIDEALGELSDLPREIVLLFHQQNWSILEIAAHLQLPEGTVKSHLHRARKRMQRTMLRRATEEHKECADRPGRTSHAGPTCIGPKAVAAALEDWT
ncbi:MAG: sigma-70 family RNA polymerase sigma factor [Phycisphaerales bacterium]|nr:sigma-70 family RNA polymerase sigma factor [Phycisphaerales bacterium]